jgi:C1A family cysteine protease
MSAFGGHPLHLHVSATRAAAAGAGGGAGAQLAELGITDAEQLVAVASIEEARGNLAATLDVSKQELDNLVKEAKKVLPPPLVAELDHPLPVVYPLGAVEPPPEARAAAEAEPAADLAEAVALPPTANLIPLMAPIRNQGARGTCVSFTLTAINEYVRRVQNHPQDLSEQHLYHEIKLVDGSPALCGTWQRVGAQVLKSRGQCRELVWPYNPNPPCNNNGVMPANARSDAAHYKVTLAAVPATNVASIKGALAGRRPVGVSIPVYNSWYLSPETKRSGRITMPLTNDTQAGGHALCAVGYQDDAAAPGGGYFIVRNHWSTSWAYQSPYGAGYGTIPYQYIAGYCWEAYTLASAVSLEEPVAPQEEAPRTVTLTIRGNVNVVLE